LRNHQFPLREKKNLRTPFLTKRKELGLKRETYLHLQQRTKKRFWGGTRQRLKKEDMSGTGGQHQVYGFSGQRRGIKRTITNNVMAKKKKRGGEHTWKGVTTKYGCEGSGGTKGKGYALLPHSGRGGRVLALGALPHRGGVFLYYHVDKGGREGSLAKCLPERQGGKHALYPREKD